MCANNLLGSGMIHSPSNEVAQKTHWILKKTAGAGILSNKRGTESVSERSQPKRSSVHVPNSLNFTLAALVIRPIMALERGI